MMVSLKEETTERIMEDQEEDICQTETVKENANGIRHSARKTLRCY